MVEYFIVTMGEGGGGQKAKFSMVKVIHLNFYRKFWSQKATFVNLTIDHRANSMVSMVAW